MITGGFPGGAVVKNLPANAGDTEIRVWSLGWEHPLEKEMATQSVLLPGKSHRQRSLGVKRQTRLSRQIATTTANYHWPLLLNCYYCLCIYVFFFLEEKNLFYKILLKNLNKCLRSECPASLCAFCPVRSECSCHWLRNAFNFCLVRIMVAQFLVFEGVSCLYLALILKGSV